MHPTSRVTFSSMFNTVLVFALIRAECHSHMPPLVKAKYQIFFFRPDFQSIQCLRYLFAWTEGFRFSRTAWQILFVSCNTRCITNRERFVVKEDRATHSHYPALSYGVSEFQCNDIVQDLSLFIILGSQKLYLSTSSFFFALYRLKSPNDFSVFQQFKKVPGLPIYMSAGIFKN